MAGGIDLLAPRPATAAPAAAAPLPAGGRDLLMRPAANAATPAASTATSDEDWYRQTYGRPAPLNSPNSDYMTQTQLSQMRQREDPQGATAWQQELQRRVAAGRGGVAETVGPQTATGGPVLADPNFQPGVTPERFMRAVGQGTGLGDEVSAFIAGIGGIFTPQGFGGTFRQTLDAERQAAVNFRATNTGAAMVGELAGAAPLAAIPGAGVVRAGTTAGRAIAGAAGGAAAGAVYGAGAADGGNMLRSVALNAGAGAIGGALVPYVAPWAARTASAVYGALRAPFRGFTTRAASGLVPAERVAATSRFSIPLTRGQATGNVRQMATEQEMLAGTRGQMAADRLRAFAESQNEAVRAAAIDIATQVSGPLARQVATAEAGDLVTAGMRREATQARNTAQEMYRRAAALPAAISDGTAANFPGHVAQTLANSDFVMDPVLHPAAFRAMQEIGNLPDFAVDGMVGLQDIERIRRRVIQLEGSTDSDGAALGRVIDAFDDGIEDMMNAQLFSGDPRALELLVGARAEWARYRSMTRKTPNDDASRVVSDMILRDVTPEQVANWMFGSTAVNPGSRAVRVASTLRDVLGQESAEWNAIRSAAFSNLITPRGDATGFLSPTVIANNITGFVNGQGASLASALFTAGERDLMKQYANALRILVPDRMATNVSGSGYVTRRAIGAATTQAVAAFGYSAGGIPGLVASMVGQPIISGVKNAMAVRRALNPAAAQPLIRDPAAAGRLLSYVLVPANSILTPRLATASSPVE